jgi:predicted lipid carrier protein YhbT
MSGNHSLPRIPAPVRFGLRPVPTPVIEIALKELARSIARRHPSMFERLGTHSGKRFVLQPTDLPFLISLTLDPIDPVVSIVRSRSELHADAWISGPFAALIGLAHGRFDGDALFFSGDLAIEGDVEAILAFRNALDDAEIDLLQEGAAILGPLSGAVEVFARPAAELIERYTGFAFTRGRPVVP